MPSRLPAGRRRYSERRALMLKESKVA